MPKSQPWVSIRDSCIRIKKLNVLAMVIARYATSTSEAVASPSPIRHGGHHMLQLVSMRLVRLEFGDMVNRRRRTGAWHWTSLTGSRPNPSDEAKRCPSTTPATAHAAPRQPLQNTKPTQNRNKRQDLIIR